MWIQQFAKKATTITNAIANDSTIKEKRISIETFCLGKRQQRGRLPQNPRAFLEQNRKPFLVCQGKQRDSKEHCDARNPKVAFLQE